MSSCAPHCLLPAPESSFLERLNAVEEELDCGPAYTYHQVPPPPPPASSLLWASVCLTVCLSVPGQEAGGRWGSGGLQLFGVPHALQAPPGPRSSGSAGGGASGPGCPRGRARRSPAGGGPPLDQVASGSHGARQRRSDVHSGVPSGTPRSTGPEPRSSRTLLPQRKLMTTTTRSTTSWKTKMSPIWRTTGRTVLYRSPVSTVERVQGLRTPRAASCSHVFFSREGGERAAGGAL